MFGTKIIVLAIYVAILFLIGIVASRRINKMSDYCKGCRYNVKEKVGSNACPLNSLYWNFIDKNYDKFASNHRMSFPVRNWDKMDQAKKIEITEHASELLNNLSSL